MLSADGAMVPLVAGTWAEVKTLVLGEVGEPDNVAGELVVHTTGLSYFSRLTDSQTFERLALIETHRRGVESAGAVVAVTDGAEWLQGFIQYHRPDAVRVLDFPHAAEYVSTIGALALGDGHRPPPAWLATQLHQLKHAGPTPVLTELRTLAQAQPTLSEVADALAYLEKREALMQYPTFQAAGWPIGSGSVESANKLVVEARLNAGSTSPGGSTPAATSVAQTITSPSRSTPSNGQPSLACAHWQSSLPAQDFLPMNPKL